MAIDITAAGQVGTHSFRKVNVNTDDNYIYFTGLGNDTPPAEITEGTSYIYTSGIGSIGGITEGDLVYATFENDRVLKFLDDQDQEIDLTSATPGGTSFNFPVVYDNILNIGSPSASNQAVKYYTDGTPLTGLTSGDTYFLKTVPATFTGTTALYEITNDTHTFTTCGKTGRQGPNASEIALGYSTDWHGTYIQEGNFRGYQDWTVPVSGVYRFDVKGASGYEGDGAGSADANRAGGDGGGGGAGGNNSNNFQAGSNGSVNPGVSGPANTGTGGGGNDGGPGNKGNGGSGIVIIRYEITEAEYNNG